MLEGKKILLIVTGGIAAYKSPDLVRRLRQRGAQVRCVLTAGGAEFVTALALGAVSEDKVYETLFSLTDEDEMGHIRLSREADVILVAPATANILAKMASGIADDLASTALLATDKPILAAPAMNVRMWENPATRENLGVLAERGVGFIGPEEGDMACGEWGLGRMSEPARIAEATEDFFRQGPPSAGARASAPSGPTAVAIDMSCNDSLLNIASLEASKPDSKGIPSSSLRPITKNSTPAAMRAAFEYFYHRAHCKIPFTEW